MDLKPSSEQVYEANSVKGMLHKNCLEKVVFERKQKNLEYEKRCLLRQHSRDETEIKQILYRLQYEQTLLADEEDKTGEDSEDSSHHESEDGNDDTSTVVNPYPVTIVPKFGPTSPRQDVLLKVQKGVQKTTGSRIGRRKSLEYEDIENTLLLRKSRQQQSKTQTTAQTTRHHNQGSSRRPQPIAEHNETLDTWVGDPEFISSVRRPLKPASEFGQKKFLKRALSEIWLRPNSALTALSTSVTTMRRGGSLKSKRDKEESDKSGTDFRNEQPPDNDDAKKSTSSPKRKTSIESRKNSFSDSKTSKESVSRHERKGSLKDRKCSGQEKVGELSSEKEADGYGSQSKQCDDECDKKYLQLAKGEKKEVTEKATRQNTRHGSLKKKKEKLRDKEDILPNTQRTRHGLLTPLALKTDNEEPDSPPADSYITRMRSKSMGTTPNSSPLASPVVKDAKFHY